MKALLLILIASPAFAGTSAGSTGASFLRIPAGTRGAAMAGAQTASGEGPFSLFWNPSSLSRLEKKGEVAFLHNRWFGLMDHQALAASFRLKDAGIVVSGGLLRLATYQRGFDENAQPTGDFGTSDMALCMAIGKAVEVRKDEAFEESRNLRLGAGLKLIRQEVRGTSASGIAGDIGASFAPFEDGSRRWVLALAVNNLGPPMGLGAKSPLPRTIIVGTAYLHKQSGLMGELDVEHAAQGPAVRLGLEWCPLNPISARAGWRSGMPGRPMDALSFGGAMHWKSLEFGGAFLMHADLGGSMLFDLKYGW